MGLPVTQALEGFFYNRGGHYGILRLLTGKLGLLQNIATLDQQLETGQVPSSVKF